MSELPRRTGWPSSTACRPLPVIALKSLTASIGSDCVLMCSIMAVARGCSERFSNAAARTRTSARANPSLAMICCTLGLPSVRVPVLSTISVSTFSINSKPSASLISTPSRAPRPIPTITEIGVANPNAHGQAMMSTDTAATKPCAIPGAGPSVVQRMKLKIAMPITVGTNHPDTRSASFCIGARDRPA